MMRSANQNIDYKIDQDWLQINKAALSDIMTVNLQIGLLFLLFDPVEGLLLGVNTQGEAAGSGGQDAILHWKFIWRKTFRSPSKRMHTDFPSSPANTQLISILLHITWWLTCWSPPHQWAGFLFGKAGSEECLSPGHLPATPHTPFHCESPS